jgi:hypothetical protein
MSSKPIASRSRVELKTRQASTFIHAPAATPLASKKRGRPQPQTENFQVVLDLPLAPPILERELRAIEVLLGRELQDLLADVEGSRQKIAVDNPSGEIHESNVENAVGVECRRVLP